MSEKEKLELVEEGNVAETAIESERCVEAKTMMERKPSELSVRREWLQNAQQTKKEK